MEFASPLPLWAAAIAAVAIAAVAYLSYKRPLVPLSSGRRAALMLLRAVSLGLVVLFLCRPTVLVPPSGSGEAVVPILIDTSRSMRVSDVSDMNARGVTRMAAAVDVVTTQLLPLIQGKFTPELYRVGDGAEPIEAAALRSLPADARRSALSAALGTVRERSRGRRIAGIVLVSDGGETGEPMPDDESSGPPVFAVGVGSVERLPDRELLAVTAGDPRLDQSSVDLRVSAVSHGLGRAPFEVRVTANGRPLETRTMVPLSDGSPVDDVFTVSPDPVTPTVYTAEIVAQQQDEAILENNVRSVLVSPPGRKRRVLMLSGAPGYDHSFALRALAADTSLEVDSVVRKGKNDAGQDTFLVQAAAGRTASLMAGLPPSREAVFAYDALVIANIEGEFFTRAQLALVSEFVSERGGGLLVFGGQSFGPRALMGTPLEVVLPVELGDRRGLVARTTAAVDRSAPNHTVLVTSEGQSHPVMRIAPTPAESAKVWEGLPALAGTALLGGPRAGASVLAVTTTPAGGVYPLIAVQRYGRGRSMAFAGEASWRWRMLRPSADRSYEFFWRQAVRWLAGPSPDPVSVTAPPSSEAGDALAIVIDARDASFAPAADAQLDATLTQPGGETLPLVVRHEAGAGGRFAATVRPEREGLYRTHVEARRGARALGLADAWFYVGGADREFADPRLNEAFLKRVARDTGGRYVSAADAAQVVSWLESAAPGTLEPERRDVWHEPWAFGLVIGLLGAEWVLRRRWGLR